MLYEQITKALKITGISCVMALVASCGTSEADKAHQLYDKANDAFERGEWDASISMLAEIDSLYKGELDVRKKARHLRPKVIEQQTLMQISTNDSLLAVNKWVGDSLTKYFRVVNNALERYYVSKNAPADVNSRPGLYARMSPDGVLYFVAVSKGVTANQVQIAGAQSAIIPYDGERNDRFNGNQVITFVEKEFENLLPVIASHTGSSAELTFLNNGKNIGKLTLKASDVEALNQVCQTAVNLRNYRLLTIERERLERTLTVARNQIARTMPDTITTE